MEVIHVKSELKSFSWNDGLFIIIKETPDEYRMCKLDDGKPELYDDGTYMITCTGKHNKGITRTNLTFNE